MQFGESQDIDGVELAANDRVAALDDNGKMRKGRVAVVVPGSVGVTFAKGEAPVMRNRSEVLPLYRYDPSGTLVTYFITLPAAK